MPKPKGPEPTLPQYADDFLNDFGAVSKTVASYRTALISFQRFAEGQNLTARNASLSPQLLYPEVLADYYSWLREQRYRNASIRLYVVVAGQYFEWLESEGELSDKLHAAQMRALLQKKTGRRGRRLRPERRGSDDAIGVLLAHYAAELASAPPHPKNDKDRVSRKRLTLLRNHALLHTLYATAGRAAEVASLQRADVAQGQATQVEIIGKGNKKRTLILTQPAQKAIQAYLAARTDSGAGLFVSHGPYRDQPLTTQSIWKIVNEAAKAVFGADKKGHPLRRVGPHSFRHLRAQHLVDNGMPIDSLQALLGHESIATTRDTYAPKTPVNKLEDEVATYGRDPQEVIQAARKVLKKTDEEQ